MAKQITPQRLIDAEICTSFAECRRIISSVRISKKCRNKIETQLEQKESK